MNMEEACHMDVSMRAVRSTPQSRPLTGSVKDLHPSGRHRKTDSRIDRISRWRLIPQWSQEQFNGLLKTTEPK